MVFVKLRRNTAGGMDYIRRLLRYFRYDSKTGKERKDYVSMNGFGVDYVNLEYAYHQMKEVRKYFGKVSGNPLAHYIVSFDEDVYDSLLAEHIAFMIAEYFKYDYQVIWAIHCKKRGDSLFHVHFLINSVSYKNGRMIETYRTDVESFAKFIHEKFHCKVQYCVGQFTDEI